MGARSIITVLLFVAVSFWGQAQLSHTLDEFTVHGKRSMQDIGIQKTVIDSVALKENIALSMADVIGFRSSVFVKSFGRATLSTVSMRGTAPSHTSVAWNGIPINSPALGMTDFSLIPAYFIDKADLLYGASSMGRSSGGLGGMVDLATSLSDIPEGLNLQYVQGIGSFMTFDEFLRISYSKGCWKASTRAVYSSSKNDFSFINHDKKENIYNDNHEIVDSYHPTENNKNGAYHDFHILQQVYYSPTDCDDISLDVWYTGSSREIPLTTVDYLESRRYENNQHENTLRSVLSWSHIGSRWRGKIKGGYIHSWIAYNYGFSISDDLFNKMIESRTHINTVFGNANFDYNASEKLFFNGDVSVTHNHIRAADEASMLKLGYDTGRTDVDVSVSARWQPSEALGLRALVREDINGSRWSDVQPAVFADYMVFKPFNLMLKASAASTYHAPTLNDLYFVPGGNPDLKSEHGFSYDAGFSFSKTFDKIAVSASANCFNMHINDWILWLPTQKGFFSPQNVKKVHSYGFEANSSLGLKPFADAYLDFDMSYSLTKSVNNSPAVSEFDKSVGQQLPYVPVHSASLSASLSWHKWTLLWKSCYYSKRYTMTSGEINSSGHLPHYFMTNISIERRLPLRPVDMSFKLAVNNLFDADYQTVMAHPMPGTNFEFFISITPRFNSNKSTSTIY